MSDEPKNGDRELAEMFVLAHGEHVRYVPEWNEWMVWTGKRWEADAEGIKVQGLVKKFTPSFTAARRIMAYSRDLVAISPEEFDADPYYVNTPDGAFRLVPENAEEWEELGDQAHETLQLPGDYCTKITTVPWYRGIIPHNWLVYLEEVQPDEEMRKYLQQWAGYFLLGRIREHEMLVFLGDGANGKSVFVEVMLGIMGSYAAPGSQSLLIEKKLEEHAESLASTKGLRLCVVSETPARARLNEARVKQLTAGDRVTARKMRQNSWNFTPTAKLLMMTNNRPTIEGTDEGIWRRIRIVPWLITVPVEKRNPDLARFLIATEGPGILHWMLEGYQMYQQDGLTAPAIVEESRQQYRKESDVVSLFLEEGGYETGDTSALMTSTTILYADLDRFCKEAGLAPPSRVDRRKAFEAKGFIYRKSNGNVLVCGLCKTDHVKYSV